MSEVSRNVLEVIEEKNTNEAIPDNNSKVSLKLDNSLPDVDLIWDFTKLKTTKEIWEYLINLDNRIDSLTSLNELELAKLNNALIYLTKTIENLLSTWDLSEKSANYAKQINEELAKLWKILQNKEQFNIENISMLKNNVVEIKIDEILSEIKNFIWLESTFLTIWVNKYTSWVHNLKWAVNDSNAVSNKIKSLYGPSINIQQLHDEKASKYDILSYIENSPKDKPIFIYYAWHWIDWYMLPYIIWNINPKDHNELLSQWISPEELYRAIWERKAIVIVDQCFWWDIAKHAPKNIKVISSTDNKSTAAESMWRMRNVWMVTLVGREEHWNWSVPRWDFTKKVTDYDWGLNLLKAVNETEKQSPKIS